MRPKFELRAVRLIPADGDENYLHREAEPGALFLFGPLGMTGGLLKLTRRGEFVTLTRAQVYLREPWRWPWSDRWFSIVEGKLTTCEPRLTATKIKAAPPCEAPG